MKTVYAPANVTKKMMSDQLQLICCAMLSTRSLEAAEPRKAIQLEVRPQPHKTLFLYQAAYGKPIQANPGHIRNNPSEIHRNSPT